MEAREIKSFEVFVNLGRKGKGRRVSGITTDII